MVGADFCVRPPDGRPHRVGLTSGMCHGNFRKRIVMLLLILLGFLLTPNSAQSQETVRIGLSVRNVVLMPFYYAQDKGYFEREGLKAELIQIRSNLQVAGVVSGE